MQDRRGIEWAAGIRRRISGAAWPQGAGGWIAAVVLALFAGLALEICLSLPAIRAAGGGGASFRAIPFDQVIAEGFEKRDGTLTLTGDSAFL